MSIHARLEDPGCSTDPTRNSCSPGELKAPIPQWVFYLLAMAFDATTVCLSSFLFLRSGTCNRCAPTYLTTTQTRLINLVEHPRP